MSWTLAPNAQLQWRSWEGETVVYHPPSGDTHILHPLAAEILRHLDGHTIDIAQLAAHVAQTFDLQPDEELHRQIEYCINQFTNLGLIVHVPD